MNNETKTRGEITRDPIVNAAYQLFVHQGYTGRLCAIKRPGVGAGGIHAAVEAARGRLIALREVEPTLEDVFLALAAEQ
jgi:hypothetical protein